MESDSKIHDAGHAALLQSYVARHAKGYDFFVEYPYNHYGVRGVIDVLLVSKTDKKLVVAEIKNTIGDIGHAIRQITQAKNFFLKAAGSEFIKENEPCDISYPLVIKATQENLRQILDHRHLFHGIEIVFFHDDIGIEKAVQTQYEISLALKTAVDHHKGATA